MRHTLTISSSMMKPQIEQTCVHQVLKQFLVESQNVKKMVEKGRAFVEKIKVLQRRFSAKVATRNCKVHVLDMRWNQILQQLEKQNLANLESGGKKPDKVDKEMQALLRAFRGIDEEVRIAVLERFMLRSKLKFGVAFSQWRNQKPNVDKKQLAANVAILSQEFFRTINV